MKPAAKVLIITTGLLGASAAAYALTRKDPPPIDALKDMPPEELKNLLVSNAAAAPKPPEGSVVEDVAKTLGIAAGAVKSITALIPAAKVIASIGASAGAAAGTAGVSAAQIPTVVAAAEQAAAGTMAAGGTATSASASAAAVVAPVIGVALVVVWAAVMVDLVSGIPAYDADNWDYRLMERQGIKLTPEQVKRMNDMIATGKFKRYNAFIQVLTPWQAMQIPGYMDPNNPALWYHNISPEGEPGVYVAEGRETVFAGLGALRPAIRIQPTRRQVRLWKSIVNNPKFIDKSKLLPMTRLGFSSPGKQLGNIFDDISNWTTKATDTYNQYAQVLDPIRDSAIKSVVQSTTGGSTQAPLTVKAPVQPGPGPAPTSPGLSTGAKVAIGIAGAGLLAGVIYVATSKKKGLGGGSSGVANNNLAQSTVFNGAKSKKRKTKKRK